MQRSLRHRWIFAFSLSLLWLLAACSTTSDKTNAPVYLIKIERGDTLASIATKYDTTWQNIAKLNKLEHGSNLEVGMILRVRPGQGGLIAGADRSKRDNLARRLPKQIKAQSRTYREEELPNRPAAEPEAFSEEELESRHDTNASAPKARRGLLFGDDRASVDGGLMQWPTKGGISSPFGKRDRRMHEGIDIRAPYGAPVYAAANGRVVFEGRKGGYGQMIIIRHGQQQTLYAHLSSIFVNEGDVVDTETLIGKVGASGNAKGAHLHFEIQDRRGVAVNPLPYLARNRYLSGRSSKTHAPLN